MFSVPPKGHLKRVYLKRKNKFKESKEKTTNIVVICNDQEEGYDSTGVLMGSYSQTEGKLVIESGHTYHKCPDRHLFTSYQLYNGAKVIIGDNSSCKVVGIASINLK